MTDDTKEHMQIAASNKRHSRITDARLAMRRCDRYLQTHPAASASEIMRDARLALAGLLEEIGTP